MIGNLAVKMILAILEASTFSSSTRGMVWAHAVYVTATIVMSRTLPVGGFQNVFSKCRVHSWEIGMVNHVHSRCGVRAEEDPVAYEVLCFVNSQAVARLEWEVV